MEIVKLSQEAIDQQLTAQGQANSSGAFEMLRSGKSSTPRSPLFRGVPQDVVITDWISTVLDRYAQDYNISELVKYDKSRTVKVGPQGGYPPLDDRMDALTKYWTTPEDINRASLDKEMCHEIYLELFGNAKDKRPMSCERIIEQDRYDDKLITNSGCPDFGKRSDPAIISKAIADACSGKWKTYNMILGSRSQRGKARFIFMAPFSLNLVEKQYLYPLMDCIRNTGNPFFSAWEGFDEVERGLYHQRFFRKGSTYIQQDYTAMDQHINSFCMDIVYEVCNLVFQEGHRESFRELLNHILNIGVMTQLDKVITGPHGMPSGSGFTNFAESIVSYYVTKSYLRSGLFVQAAQGLGDDLVLSIDGVNTEEHIARVMNENSNAVGLVVEPEKQRIDGQTTIYLQRFFDVNIPNEGIVLGMYPSILALNTAMNPERFHDPRKWSSEMEILRWIMILENCKNLPYFHDLIDYFIKGDKFKLGLTDPEFFIKLPSTYEDSKAIKGFIPSYNQEGLTRGINSFETVKYLMKLGIKS
uniref:RdRp n=1 Tax=viral metagenome TaxID=1070528 RepID=A0A2V0RIY7_9ZZZZ